MNVDQQFFDINNFGVISPALGKVAHTISNYRSFITLARYPEKSDWKCSEEFICIFKYPLKSEVGLMNEACRGSGGLLMSTIKAMIQNIQHPEYINIRNGIMMMKSIVSKPKPRVCCAEY
jgi:hypothetical protein